MKKLFERKPIILFLAGVGLAGLIYLAAGLRNIQFRPPEPLGFGLDSQPSGVVAFPLLELPLWIYLVCFGVLLMLLTVAVGVLEPRMRKQMMKGMLRFMLTMAFISWLMREQLKNVDLSQALNIPSLTVPGVPAGQGTSGPLYAPPQVSSWLVFGLSFLVAVILLVAAWLLYRRWQNQRSTGSLGKIAGIARRTIEELADGCNWDDAIVQCYVRMNQVVTAQRGLIRQRGTTPSEFAARMERNGLPGEAVRTLTRLFEQVRYGRITPSADDRNMAVAALNAILGACGETQ